MATKHYKAIMKNGRYVKMPMTQREVKRFIMQVNNWTDEQYRKNYDIFKNKLRAYEAVQASLSGKKVYPQSPIDVLYAEAKSKKAYGEDYAPSMKMKQIQSMTAYSITKGRKMAQQEAYKEAQSEKYGKYVETRFSGLIDFARDDVATNGVKAANISKTILAMMKDIKNPIDLERALSDLATKWERMRRDAKSLIGEHVGSDESDMNFDYSDYL